jgi:multiple sugar transport system substrate-binding protein
MTTEAHALPAGSRRRFLQATAFGVAGAALGVRPGLSAPKTMSIMHENSFIKTFDEYFQKTLIPAYEKLTGVKIKYELVSVGGLQTRVTTVAETATGPDMTLNFFNWPFLYDEKYVDVGDIAEEAGKNNGGWHDAAREAVVVNGKWKAVPFGNVGQLMNWRTDWFKEAGYDKFPETWDELLEAGIKLKANGHPFGFELGHGFGDNHGWLYPLLWSYGGREVEPDGKTVVIDSAETARAVDFARIFFQKTMLEDVLGWTDPNNNKAYLSGQISCTNNAESILWAAKRDFPHIAQATDQSLNPKGPTGQRFHILAPWSHSIFTHTPDQQAAKDFLRWLMEPAQVGGWYASADSYYAPFLHAFDDAPLWHVEPRNIPYRDSLATSHLPGWPAPVSRASSESVAKYVVVDMFAKACAGKSTKEVIADANAQLKQIYRPA